MMRRSSRSARSAGALLLALSRLCSRSPIPPAYRLALIPGYGATSGAQDRFGETNV
jgi:hypothetical protein